MLISCKEESRKLLLRESIKELCPVSTVASPLTSITEKEFGSCNILCEVSSLNHCHQQMSFPYWEWILLNWWNKGLCSWIAIIYLEDCYRYCKICFPPPPTSSHLLQAVVFSRWSYGTKHTERKIWSGKWYARGETWNLPYKYRDTQNEGLTYCTTSYLGDNPHNWIIDFGLCQIFGGRQGRGAELYWFWNLSQS